MVKHGQSGPTNLECLRLAELSVEGVRVVGLLAQEGGGVEAVGRVRVGGGGVDDEVAIGTQHGHVAAKEGVTNVPLLANGD